MTTRADRVQRLTADLQQYTREHERMLRDHGAPEYLRYLADRVVEDELSRARISGQVPAWALEPRT